MAAYTVTPIGHLETPWATPADCPRNGRQPDPLPECRAVVAPEFQDGLLGLDGFSHLILLYWMDRAAPAPLVLSPRFDGDRRGIFATRAPVRPNPIALSVVALLQVEGTRLSVRGLDCLDGTPLLDLKPYFASTDARPQARVGWHAEKG